MRSTHVGRDTTDRNDRHYGMVPALVLRGRPFERLLGNERIKAYLASILGETCVLYAYTSSSMPPQSTNYSRRIHVDCPRFIPGYVTNVGLTLMLDTFSSQSGATRILPRSHLKPDEPTEEQFSADAVEILGEPGGALFFSGRTWQRGGLNQTDDWRHAVTLNACRSYMKQRFDWPRLVPREILDRNSAAFRQFIGYDVRVPSTLEEYHVPEEQRLYKPNQG
ncbi:MAG: phytanoyl-CoA dioxygenase [Gemmatimonadales bacterium]|nr:phytanoyl-CoA dioxygenase [Gemmatimonadales bacterium]